MKKLYFTIRLSYDGTLDISIPQEDVEFALYAFMTGGNVVLSSGAAMRGKDIISILPDYHRMMGFNQGYKLLPEDHHYIEKEIGNSARDFISERKQVVEDLLRTGRQNLIGKNLSQDEVLMIGGGDK